MQPARRCIKPEPGQLTACPVAAVVALDNGCGSLTASVIVIRFRPATMVCCLRGVILMAMEDAGRSAMAGTVTAVPAMEDAVE